MHVKLKRKWLLIQRWSAGTRSSNDRQAKQQLKVKKCSYGWIETTSFYFVLSIAEKLLKDELSNKEAQTKLVEKMLGDVKLN
jgi:hypothetical protein